MKKLRSSIGHDRSFIYLLFVKETFIQCYLERFLQITEALHRNRLKLILSAGMHLDPHLGTLSIVCIRPKVESKSTPLQNIP